MRDGWTPPHRTGGRVGQDGGVRKPSRRTVEVESLDKLDALLAGGAQSMSGWQLQDLDLRGRSVPGDYAVGQDPPPVGALELGQCRRG